MKKNYFIGFAVISILAFTGCTKSKTASETITETSKPVEVQELNIKNKTTNEIETKAAETTSEVITTKGPTKEVDYKVVKPYEVGQIMVIMYHGVVKENPPSPYQRTVEGFKQDLQTLYDEGFRLIKMQDLIDNNINVEAGKTPVVLTFDDGVKETFALEEKDGKLVPVEDCAIDILNKFCEANPDFGKAAALYVNANPFEGAGTLKERIEYLTGQGYEIGNHTYNHPHLKDFTKREEIEKELGLVEKMLRDAVPDLNIVGVTYPFGQRSKEEFRDAILKGLFDGKEYNYKLAFREGLSEASAAPNRNTFDPINLPRVRGNTGENTDLGWHFEMYAKNPELRYISDGNPNIIAVPKKYEENVNKDSLNGKELVLYDLD